MKLLGSTKSKITKDKNAENYKYLEYYWYIVILLITVINKIEES